MIDHDTLVEVLQIGERRRAERRRFLKMAGAGVAAAGGLAALSACGDDDSSGPPAPTPTPTPTATTAQSDIDVLNFALTLEYLEASYYSTSAFGSGLGPTQVTGTGTQGTVTGGRQVSFSDQLIASYAREIASDENEHVNFLRQQLGSAAVAMPNINIDGTATSGAFAKAAVAAGVATPAGTFDPYASDDNWLIGGMLLSDVGVTAYKGSATLITSKVILEAAAGILAVEAYHTGLIRSLLYRRGLTIAGNTDITVQGKISDTRDMLDGNPNSAGPPQLFADDDKPIATTTVNGGPQANIVPVDANGIVFGRTAGMVLNEVFQTTAAATSGGFFPTGINGNIKASTAAA